MARIFVVALSLALNACTYGRLVTREDDAWINLETNFLGISNQTLYYCSSADPTEPVCTRPILMKAFLHDPMAPTKPEAAPTKPANKPKVESKNPESPSPAIINGAMPKEDPILSINSREIDDPDERLLVEKMKLKAYQKTHPDAMTLPPDP